MSKKSARVVSFLLGASLAFSILSIPNVILTPNNLSDENKQYLREWMVMISIPLSIQSAYAIPQCPAGTSFNSTTNQCEASPTCSVGTYNPATDVCETSHTCSSGDYNQTSDQCEFTDFPDCFGGDLINDQCVEIFDPPTCDQGTPNFDTDQCESTSQPFCSDGTYNQATDQCENNEGQPTGGDPCSSGALINDECVEVFGSPECGDHGNYNPITDQCEEISAPFCSDGDYNPAINLCEGSLAATCPGDSSLNGTTDLCEIAPTCPTGTVLNTTTDVCTLLLVDVDIKPGSDPNSIKVKIEKVITVAILGSADLDVSDINATTLLFGDYAEGEGASPANKVTIKDVNKDGYLDLVSQYRLSGTGIDLGDTEACISGELLDGTQFLACDAIRTI